MTLAQRKNRRWYANLLLIISIMLLAACQSPSNTSANNRYLSSNSATANEDVREQLLDQYQSWKGVRYRLGGNSKRGIDCSAFVQRTFREQFAMNLPRTTQAQQHIGVSVKKQQLQPGDLLLFQTGRRTKHVGIYLGNTQFVHASTSQGVMISRLDNPYWSQHYRQARRVL